MTQRTTRRLAAIAIPAAGLILLAGCAGGSDGSGDGGDDGGESVEFSFMYATSNNLESPYETLANEYMEAHDGVTITTNPLPNDSYGETLRTQLQAGNAPDVIQTTPGSGDPRSVVPLAEAGFLEPLGETAAGLVPEGADALFTVDGEVYGQPMDFTLSTLVVNMSAAAEAGLDDFPATTDELLASCGEVAENGASLVVLAGAAAPNAGLTAQAIAATRVYAETPDWNDQRAAGEVTFAESDGWHDVLQTILDMKDAGCFQPGAEGAGFDAITNGLAQGTSLGSFIPSGSAVEIGRAAPDVEWAIQPFPPADGGDPYLIASSNYTISINAASENKEAAAEFLEWLAQPEQAERFSELSGELPVSGIEGLDLTGTIYEPVADLLQSGHYAGLPNAFWKGEVYEKLSSGVQGLLTGQKTVDAVLADMDAAWGD
ncbi:extracellular solute-binding protein [Microbacterium barkeri]|uniref:ABC transporter substrate-binding protein n=1 Tax=Microbacterium barkeri TaxID=33917 RepID=UPI0024AEDDC7|nr:extracellular solute-binding protein [Microbacterium barkeri]MDI6943291.1 extracellular solute-binding protein [Microbacterium barkeri]